MQPDAASVWESMGHTFAPILLVFSLMEVLSWYLPERPRKITKNVSQYSRCPGRDSNRTPPKYKSRALLVDQPLRLLFVEVLLEFKFLDAAKYSS
jgi:hypothetical protein